MKTLIISSALLGTAALAGCEDRTTPPEVPAPQPERAIEPIEEEEVETPVVIETPDPYVDDMGGDLGTFRDENDTVPEVILPEETPDTEETPPTVPPN